MLVSDGNTDANMNTGRHMNVDTNTGMIEIHDCLISFDTNTATSWSIDQNTGINTSAHAQHLLYYR